MPSIICGSLAFDTISVFHGRFAEHILPDKVHMLNVSFLVPTMRRDFGGCAGNIAYGLRQLGGTPQVVGALGEDGAPYRERLAAQGIGTEHVITVPGSMTAQAYLMTDQDNNQITSFHPGAMAHAHMAAVPAPAAGESALAILAPDGKDATLTHARQCAAHGIDYVFDPGQGLPMFTADELAALIDGARYVVVNDYEAQLVSDKLRQPLERWAEAREGAIVTRGEHGCRVWDGQSWHAVHGVTPQAVVDPTGCGDAFRAALLWALERGHSWVMAARYGNVMGALKIAHPGGQNYTASAYDLTAQVQRHYA
ncbi:MAG: carbohydrate kinase family protein [Betaproteobacteria bacterium]|nr:carbohydrate kinase family protein [Betaproteobacteria bacterium]